MLFVFFGRIHEVNEFIAFSLFILFLYLPHMIELAFLNTLQNLLAIFILKPVRLRVVDLVYVFFWSRMHDV